MSTNSSADQNRSARRRVIAVIAAQGVLGLLAVMALTLFRSEQAITVAAALQGELIVLVAIFLVAATILQMLKFELTDLIFVSLGLSAYIAMVPLLGGVIAAWTALSAAMIARWLGMLQIGPIKIDMSDSRMEYLKIFALFGTYGLPIVVGSELYLFLGGAFPTLSATTDNVGRMVVCGLAMILTNNLVLSRLMKAYGYDVQKRVSLLLNDASIYLLTLPFAICVALSYGALGWPALLALAFTGIIANYATRNLAITRSASLHQLQRLASLSNIGKTISLQLSTEELLLTIYRECSKVVDASLFSIAVYDERLDQLSFEVDVRDGQIQPRERIPASRGLNGWVLRKGEPLLLGSAREEERRGVSSVPDGMRTESWLGVPMMARDRVIGVISIQSYRKNAFSEDDILLLGSVANQAAVALENANLYKDLEGLTYALEARVQERTHELNEANLRLLAADRSKNQFLANMSHELRTPLNSIIGFSSILLDNTREAISPRFYKFLENIRTAGNHLLELINDILDLSKIEAGKMELQPDRFDLRETIAAVERVMKAIAAESKVRIAAHVSGDVPIVCLDEGRLKQILFNLLSNAVKFSPDGGPVEVRVDRLAAESSPLGLQTVRIAVEDRGVGIEPEELERIFLEFYQTGQGRRASASGTGLGLSLTRNFVELHFGTIDVKSTVGVGSTFTLYLPVDYHEARLTAGALTSRTAAVQYRAQVQ
jgi:signal transduction histidine kinase